MNTITLDNKIYREVETYARLNNLDIADVVKKSILAFLKRLSPAKSASLPQTSELPAHSKQKRGILAGVSDEKAKQQEMYSWDELCGIFSPTQSERDLLDDYLFEKYGV